MKGLVVVVVLGLMSCGHSGIAQTWKELFRQKDTQREYLILQIGALEIQSKLLSDAADISRMGLSAIGDWKGLEKELHGIFFDAKRQTGPLARQSLETLRDSRLLPADLLQRVETSWEYWEAASLDSGFLGWSEQIHRQMKIRSLNLSDELDLILGSELEMGDGERAKRLDLVTAELCRISTVLFRVQVLSTHRLGMNADKVRLGETLENW